MEMSRQNPALLNMLVLMMDFKEMRNSSDQDKNQGDEEWLKEHGSCWIDIPHMQN